MAARMVRQRRAMAMEGSCYPLNTGPGGNTLWRRPVLDEKESWPGVQLVGILRFLAASRHYTCLQDCAVRPISSRLREENQPRTCTALKFKTTCPPAIGRPKLVIG